MHSSLDSPQTVKSSYDFLGYELSLIYKAKTKIIIHVMTWVGVVTRKTEIKSKSMK